MTFAAFLIIGTVQTAAGLYSLHDASRIDADLRMNEQMLAISVLGSGLSALVCAWVIA